LVKLPQDISNISSRTWYYDIRMSWTSFENDANVARRRVSDEVYEETYTTAWTPLLAPAATQSYTVKARTVTAENSNLYNIT